MFAMALAPFRLLVLLIGLSLMPVAAAAVERDRLDAFLQVTGFDVSLESIKLSAEHAPMMLGLETSDFGSAWSHMADEVFDVDVMHELAVDILAETISDDLLTHAATFYASDLGQRLVAVENSSHMVADADAKREEGKTLYEGYGLGSGSRAEILQQLNEAVGSADNGVRAIHELQIRFIMAASNAGVMDYEIDERALRAALKEDEDELRTRVEEGGLYGAAYTYQEISDEDMLAYRDALRNPKMQRVYELMNAIQHEVMANRFEALAAKMAGMTGGEDL